MARYKLKFEPTVSTAAPVSPARGGPTDDDIFRLAVDSWSAVASKRGLSAPDSDQVMFAMTVGPEEAILTGFQWTDDREEAKSILEAYKTEVGIRRQRWSGGLATSAESAGSGGSDQSPPAVSVAPDVSKWVKSLMDVEMQCAVVSFLERDQVDVLLEYAGLADLFGPDRRVSATDGYGRESQQLLGAALRVERRPDHCVVFDCSPQSSDAAHEDQMQSVCFVGPYPRYELLAADSTAASFSELTAMNVRRLFGERVYDQPQLETQAAAPAIKKKPKVQTRFWDDDS
jgi:phosphoglycolate phosphatase-like HAD superfamily hydrolase